MWDIEDRSITGLIERYVGLPGEDSAQLERSIPDSVGVIRLRGVRGGSIQDIAYKAVRTYSNFCGDIEYGWQEGNIKTIIFVLPNFCFRDYIDTESTHLNGYRGLGKDLIVVNGDEPIIGDSLSLVHEFRSGKNAWTITENVTEIVDNTPVNRQVDVLKEKSYILGQVFKATDTFRDQLASYCGEKHKDLVENIFFVTSAYTDSSDINSFKSIHIIMKGIYLALGKKNNVPLQKWIENYRRKGAEDYISDLISTQQREKDNLEYEMNSLRKQMDTYFKKLTPIDFFLADQEGILGKINKALIDCEKVKGVKSAYLDNEGSFHMDTDHIYIKHPTTIVTEPGQEVVVPQNLYWDIGRLHITTKKNGKVSIISDTRQVIALGGRAVGHPHVINQNGETCLGEIKLIVLDLINQHHYPTLAGILINFARSVNLDDSAGKTVTSWPTVQLNPS